VNALPLALALTFASVAVGAALPADPAARVRVLGERYREHLLAHRPDLAARWSVDGARLAIAPLTEVTLARDARFTADLAREVEAVPVAKLDAESASLHRMLMGRLAEERAQVAEQGTLRRDAFAWVKLVRDVADHALAAPRSQPCDRASALAGLLRATPELWRGAVVVLREPTPGSALADSLAAARQWLRGSLSPHVLDCRDALRLGAFVQADSQAVQALETFATFMLADSTFATPRGSEARSPRGAAGR